MTEPKKMGWGKKLGIGCLGVIGAFVALGIIGAIVGDKNGTGKAPVAAAIDQPASGASAATQVAEKPTPSLTGPQENALRSAKQYLSMQGFSRNGLINQLSSRAGDGYDVADATAAVDSMDVDWNEQAAESAKQYLSMQGFSCKGLINQLSSRAGDKYTVSQATYGAKKAGAC